MLPHRRLVLRAAATRRGCAAAATSTFESKSASAGTTPAADTTAVLPLELAEHERYLKFCRDVAKINFFSASPAKICSASRLIRCNDAAKDATSAAPDADAASESIAAFDFRGGRGLVATRDVARGSPLLMASVESAAINTQTLAAQARNRAASQGGRVYLDDATNIAFTALPNEERIQQIAQDMLIRDAYYVYQFHLTTWIAWERCDGDSPIRPYLDTLPVPAIDDDVVLGMHAGGLTTFQAKEYTDLHQDFIVSLRRVRDSWLDGIKRLPVDAAAKEAALKRVPPMQVFDWAWRIVLSRQTPLPPLGIAPPMTCFRGDVNKSVSYVQWMEMTNQLESLYPSLVPVFDLVDHHLIPNCELDCIMRPVKAAGTNELDFDVMQQSIEAIKQHDREHKRIVQVKGVKPLYRGGAASLMRTFERVKGVADAAQRFLAGQSQEVEAPLPPGSEKSALPDLQELLSTAPQQPFVELRATTAIKAGQPLVYTFSHTHSWAMTLYRFGFLPT